MHVLLFLQSSVEWTWDELGNKKCHSSHFIVITIVVFNDSFEDLKVKKRLEMVQRSKLCVFLESALVYNINLIIKI